MAVSQAVNQANKQTVRPYHIQTMRQAAAKALLEGSFTSFKALGPSPAANEKLVADRARLEHLALDAAQKATQHLHAIASEGKLPHRLEHYYFAQGVLRAVGQTETGKYVMASFPNPDPAKTTYAPYHHIWVPEDKAVPPSLEALGYVRDTVRPQFELMKNLFMLSYQNLDHAMGHFVKTSIDGVECLVVTLEREKINRRKILGSVFKPLGYEFVKQPQGSVGSYELRKPLTTTESLRCLFDFGTWRQTIDCSFTYHSDDFKPRLSSFRIPITGWSYPTSIEISSEELFTKAIENIGAMVEIVEKEHILSLRPALKALC
jgi:hypothetical protein